MRVIADGEPPRPESRDSVIVIYQTYNLVTTVLHVSTPLGEKMDFFGLTDPWIVGGYVGSFACVAFCVIYGFLKGRNEEEDDGE